MPTKHLPEPEVNEEEAAAEAQAAAEAEAEEIEAREQHQAKAGAKVEKAAERRYVRGGPDGPVEIEGVLRRSTDKSEPTWTRGDDPEAAALALAEASVGTTGGPFAGSYNHAAQALAEPEQPVSEEDRIAGQHRAHAAAHPEITEEEAQAKADEDAKAKKDAADKATKGAEGSAEGGAKEAKDAPAGTGDTAPPAD